MLSTCEEATEELLTSTWRKPIQAFDYNDAQGHYWWQHENYFLHLILCCLYLGLPSLTSNYVREYRTERPKILVDCFLPSMDLSCITSCTELKFSGLTSLLRTNNLSSFLACKWFCIDSWKMDALIMRNFFASLSNYSNSCGTNRWYIKRSFLFHENIASTSHTKI